jgi:hypothetical protein
MAEAIHGRLEVSVEILICTIFEKDCILHNSTAELRLPLPYIKDCCKRLVFIAVLKKIVGRNFCTRWLNSLQEI